MSGLEPPSSQPVVELRDLQVHFPIAHSKEPLRAVDGVSLAIDRGTTFGLIGESGSGKSTVARAVSRLVPIAGGEVLLNGRRVDDLRGRKLRAIRRDVQMVFQDPHDSLDPRMTIVKSIAEPLNAFGSSSRREVRERVAELLDRVGLDAHHGERKPHALSGGQKQRVNIARALALDPDLLICDEAVSALDVSVQAGILNLLIDLQRDLGLAYLFISHDLGVVAHIADVIGVMYLGRLVEVGSTLSLLERPRHPYTEALLGAEPEPLPVELRRAGREPLVGDIPSPMNPPSGCRFRTRCPYARERCALESPPLELVDDVLVACHFAGELHLDGRTVEAPDQAPVRADRSTSKAAPDSSAWAARSTDQRSPTNHHDNGGQTS